MSDGIQMSDTKDIREELAAACLGFEGSWDTETSDADPGPGNVRGNNQDDASVTQLFVSKTDGTGEDLTDLFDGLSTDSVFFVTEKEDSKRFILGYLSGSLVDETNYWKVSLRDVEAGQQPLRDGRPLEIQLLKWVPAS